MTPRNPGPPNQPKTFWAPCAQKTTPSATRTMSSGRETKVPRSTSMTLTSWTGRAMRGPPRHIPLPRREPMRRLIGRTVGCDTPPCQVFTLVGLERCGPSRELLGRHVFDVRGDVPDVPEGILQGAGRMPFRDGSHALAHLASPYRIRGGAPAVAPPPGPPTSLRDFTALLLALSRASPYRIQGGAPAVAPPPGPPPACGISPHFSLRSIEPLLTGSGGSAGCRSSPGPPTSLRDFTALLLALSGMLPRPGRLTRQQGGARCDDSCGSSVWFSPSR